MGAFDGKVVLVTGASSGMGRAAAIRLGAGGATVIVAARREPEGQATVASVNAAGGRGLFKQVDIASPSSIDALFEAIGREHGRLDGAINNAGIEADGMSLPDTPAEVFDRVFATNVRGTWLCLRHEMRIMREQKCGAIVNVASIAGIVGVAGASVYTASKHAVVGMTKTAGLDFAALGIRVNCLCPGAMHTAMAERWGSLLPNGMDDLAQIVPMKRLATPEEMAGAALWLLSEAASYMTGSVMVVDGGLSVG